MKRAYPFSREACHSSSTYMPESMNNPTVPNLLWISRHQQQHPSVLAHPLKNTIRVNSRGLRLKFDGKQWRPLCQSSNGYECRNLAFRSSLCQKHFYKVHLLKRPFAPKSCPDTQPSDVLKRPFPANCDEPSAKRTHPITEETDEVEEDDEPIEVTENQESVDHKLETTHSHSEFSLFCIDDDPPAAATGTPVKSEFPASYAVPTNAPAQRSDSIISNESEWTSLASLGPSRPGIPPLTRTEEKSLASELIRQLPSDASCAVGEQLARRRACEIVFDNYSQRLSSSSISSDWFYDFLLRNPRVPIHFQCWFSATKPTLPLSDQLVDIKVWQLGLVTRSSVPSSFVTTSSSYSP